MTKYRMKAVAESLQSSGTLGSTLRTTVSSVIAFFAGAALTGATLTAALAAAALAAVLAAALADCARAAEVVAEVGRGN